MPDTASPRRPASLKVSALSARYGGVEALHPVSFALEAGTTLAVLGPNGAGKTTLANALGGLIPSTSEHLLVDGEDISRFPTFKRARAGIGHLPDSRAVFPSLSVDENLRMAFHRFSRERAADCIRTTFDHFPSLAARRGVPAGKLSGGEQQMLAFARLLVDPPRVLIVDELSHGLAPGIVAYLFASLEALKAQSTIVLIEQFVARAVALADTVLVLSHGRVTHSGPASGFTSAQAAKLYSLDRIGEAP